MKKRLLAIAMCVTLAFSLTGCGGSSKQAAQTQAATTQEATTQAAETEAAEEMCSDEVFESMQDIFAQLTELHNQVIDIYSSEEIAADKELEDALNECADVINMMGELTQDQISNDDAIALLDSMGELAEALGEAALAMGTEAAEAADTAAVCTDETFAALQEGYQAMVEAYNAVADAYMSDAIEQNDEIEAHLEQAKNLIEQLGEIQQADLTEADAEDVVDAIMAILEYLDAIVNQLG